TCRPCNDSKRRQEACGYRRGCEGREKPETSTQADGKLNEKKSAAVDNVTDKKPKVTTAVTDQKKSEVNAVDNKTDEKKMMTIGSANEKQNDSTTKIPEKVKPEDLYKKSVVTKISGT